MSAFIPIQWKTPLGALGFCSVVLAQDTAAEALPESESKPPPAADEQPVPDDESDSIVESEQAPVADPEGSLPEVDPGEQEPPVEEPGATAEPKDAQPVDSKQPEPDKPKKKPFYGLDSGKEEEEDLPPLPSSGETRWDRYHEALSRQILNTAEWIDSFFDDERVEAEENRTNIKLRFDTDIKEGQGLDFRIRARVRLVLPRMEKRLSLVISGDPDEDIQEGTVGDSIGGEQFDSSDDQSVTAAFWYSFLDTYKRNLSMRVGARWRDGGPVLWLGPRYRQLWTFDPWAARYTWSLRWFTDVGLESRMRLDFERPVFKSWFFRQTTTYDWDQEQDVGFKLDDGSTETITVKGFNRLAFSVNLFQPLNRLSILQYGTGIEFVDQPKNLLNNVTVFVKYRRQIWREWLFFEVTPALEFPWIRDYKTTPSILLRFEGIFGKYK